MVEICTVVYGCLLGRCAAKDFWPPGVKVGIEVNDRYGTIGFGDAAEERESDGVIASQRDYSWQCFLGFCGPW